jgi:hypothetical protein
VKSPVDSAQTIEIGDLVFLNTDDIRSASQSTYAGGLATSQEAFVDNFLGVAAQGSDNGDTTDVRVDTTGVFEFDCASATFEVGDLVGPDDNATPDALMDQQVIAVTQVARAIGRVAKRVGTAATKVYVQIESTIMSGGPQAGTSST